MRKCELDEKARMQGNIQEACVPCDVVQDYSTTDGVCCVCTRRAMCAIVKADLTPDQVISALALLKRGESGESVEIRKRDGEFPEIVGSDSTGWIVGHAGSLATVCGKTLPEAAAAWNGGAA